ncbi:lipopolysaccharide biosynthesis protein [Providencia rettgeri]|nr:lipopolysaccharide biosynthesis protein [Providencia rettgeri]
MLFMIVITLYTSRIVLDVLGVTDFGIYTVVASVVTMLGFISSAMISATQRFLSFEIGRNDKVELSNTFVMSVNINILITIIALIIIETIGLWFIHFELNIPKDKLPSALWAFQCAMISFCFSVISIPYSSNIIAHEKLNVYAIISIIDVTLKLVILFFINEEQPNKLKVYSSLMCLVAFLTSMTYIFYNKFTFSITKYRLYWNTNLFKKLFSYTGWNFFGALAGVCTNQFSNVLINIFFGPTVNAAEAISSQVNSAIYGFVTAIQLSMSPQIVKSYSINDRNRTKELISTGSKLSYYFIFFISSPMIFRMDYILNIWLLSVPNYTTIFCQLIIIESLIISLSNSLMSACNATGKIKLYQIIIGSITLLNIPISFYILKKSPSPEMVFIVSIVLSIICLIARIIILNKIDRYIISGFIKIVILPVSLVSFFSLSIIYLINKFLSEGFPQFTLYIFLSLLSISFFIWFIGLTKKEKDFFSSFIKKKFTHNLT